MKKNLKRKSQQLFRLDDDELDIVHEKMECAGIINKEAYYRKKVLDGNIIRTDFTDVRNMIRLLSNSSKNLNQTARRVITDRSIFASDIIGIKGNYELLWEQGELILKSWSSYRHDNSINCAAEIIHHPSRRHIIFIFFRLFFCI